MRFFSNAVIGVGMVMMRPGLNRETEKKKEDDHRSTPHLQQAAQSPEPSVAWLAE
jgi:hypothetical protein